MSADQIKSFQAVRSGGPDRVGVRYPSVKNSYAQIKYLILFLDPEMLNK